MSTTDSALDWLEYVKPFSAGLVVAPQALRELGLDQALPQRATDSAAVAALLADGPSLPDPLAFFEGVLGWDARLVAGAPGGPALPDTLTVRLPEYQTTLAPTYAVHERQGDAVQLLVKVEAAGVDPDKRGALDGWEASAHQRFERLLRETGVAAGLLVTDRVVGTDVRAPELRLIYAPKGETSGWLGFPLLPLGTVAGRPMLAGLKLLLDRARLFTDAENRRLPALLAQSRKAQARVSTDLAEQVLGALHELLRGLDAAEPALIRALAGDADRAKHLYEGLLTVLLRLVFVLYAEDRDLLPSRSDAPSRDLYEGSYSLRGLYAKLVDDAALNPDTMAERRGGWGRMLALFRLIHAGHGTGFVRARGGKLFDPDAFPFLEGRATADEAPRVLPVSDACVLAILEGLMTLRRGAVRERISYRALDVEQIGSVYETVMGFAAALATGPALAIKAGKNNKTPVFVDLAALDAAKGEARIKHLKEVADRGNLSAGVTRTLKEAAGVLELAAALDPIADPRGAPNGAVGAGTPILQPTDERRRTGSHYTPRELTEPIVRHALEPAFERIGDEAGPETVLALKVCDPACGSGAFLVEACRQLGARLERAWAFHPAEKPAIPADEDEALHARRLVAQRCLYGVDRNPMAVDLARLSLWLATLARDHEFTFLDHAVKAGDSLVGLSREQIAAANWDAAKPGLPLFRSLMDERVARATEGREAIRSAPDDVSRVLQEATHSRVETVLDPLRDIGDAVIAAFFSADKPKARKAAREAIEAEAQAFQPNWAKISAAAEVFRRSAGWRPFHWPLEFPEVFSRENPGFDAIVGNPPFAGKNTISAQSGPVYLSWLKELHEGAHGNADLVAHFFRRAFGLLRNAAAFGLIATNTIGQGDTRATGLAAILRQGGAIARAVKRLKWPLPGAAVVVSVVHMWKGVAVRSPSLDGKQARRISAYLMNGDYDASPSLLPANDDCAFEGSKIYGTGFTFDDAEARKGGCRSVEALNEMSLSGVDIKRVFPYIGGEEINNDPLHRYDRFVIDFDDFPLRRDPSLQGWGSTAEADKAKQLQRGIVSPDYPLPVAADWPELLAIVEQYVKPERDKVERAARRERWWRFGDRQPGLYNRVSGLSHVLAVCRVSPHLSIARIALPLVFADSLDVFSYPNLAPFAVLQSRIHEVWARFFSSSMKDDLRYAPSDCFETFPFPPGYETDSVLEVAGQTYHDHRAALMVAADEGMTKTYNRFHKPEETGAAIVRLRELHDAMDRSVLAAYGWHDLAETVAPKFLTEETEDDHTYQKRYFWPSDVRDEVLARLLKLNAERHAQEAAAGIAPTRRRAAEETE